jgi:hypothetical protein
MNTNLTEILKSIPDFEDFMKLAEEIGDLSFHKMQLENKLKAREAETFAKAINEFIIDGKRPSVSHIERAYLHTGINGELMEDREKLADVSSKLDTKKLQMKVYDNMIEVWRTMSSNSRAQL